MTIKISQMNPKGSNVASADLFETDSGGVTYSVSGAEMQSLNVITNTSSTKTLALADAYSYQICNSGSAQTVTIPTNATVPFLPGTVIFLYRLGAGTVTVAPASGVTILDPDGGNLANMPQKGEVKLVLSNTTDTWIYIPTTPNVIAYNLNIQDPANPGAFPTLPSGTQFAVSGSLTGTPAANTIYSRISFANGRGFTGFSKWMGTGWNSSIGAEFGALGYIAGGSSIIAYQWNISSGITPTNPLHSWQWNAGLMTLTENGTLSGFSNISGTVITPQATLTDAATVNWNVATQQNAVLTIGGNRTLANPTNLAAGESMILKVIQDATGSRTLAYGTAYKWPGGSVPILSTAANAVDILSFYSDGTNLFGVVQLGFA